MRELRCSEQQNDLYSRVSPYYQTMKLSSRFEALCQREDRRTLYELNTVEALREAAERTPFLTPRENNEFCRLYWYGDETGGKLVVFKNGVPNKNAVQRKAFKALDSEAAPLASNASDQKQPTAKSENDGEPSEARLSQSLSRTRRRIYEIAACNKWTWFFTGTLDAAKVDRNDLNGTFKKLSQFFRDFRKTQHGDKLRYLIVPEQHKNGAWHFHGLLEGLNEDELHKFSEDEKLPLRILRTIKGGTPVYEWREYSARFGYTTLTRVRDCRAVSAYVTKYITKEMVAAHIAQGKQGHLYYASQGLKKPVIRAQGVPEKEWSPYTDYENKYVGIRRVTEEEEAQAITEFFGLWEVKTNGNGQDVQENAAGD